MSNYVKSTNFAIKDGLTTTDPAKVIKGTEIDNEYNAISNAVASKADINSPNLTGTPTTPTATAGTNTTQIASTAFVKAFLDAVLPAGIISMWSGAISAIPTGWKLCDGSNSTPDLRGKFIIGAGAIGASFTATVQGAIVTGSISGTTLTVSAVTSGTVRVGQAVNGSGINSNTVILGLGTGTGGTGTYTISISQTVTSRTVTTKSKVLEVTAVSEGSLTVGQFVSGSGIPFGTKITAFGTGSGNTGTYTIDGDELYVTSRAMASSAGTVVTGDTGGSKDAIVVSHTHTGTTDSGGAHTHSISRANYAGLNEAGAIDGSGTGYGTNTFSTASAGTHTHDFTTDSTGSSGTNANLPPYYALAYIMKA